MKKVVLQKIVFPQGERLEAHWDLFYSARRLVLGEKGLIIPASVIVDFTTYMNGFPFNKWKEYSGLNTVSLVLKASGDFEINLVGYHLDPTHPVRRLIRKEQFSFSEPTELTLDFGAVTDEFLAFELTASSESVLEGGYFYGLFEESAVRTVNLAIATTTFRKEDFITENIKLIRRELLESDDEIKDHLYVNVVDNGRTLSKDSIESRHIKLYPNDNVGGSGGFARGMYESIHMDGDITHVLLMDDDVLVMTESIRRTYTLLKVVNDEYKDAFISGAMLELDSMFFMCEDVGMLRENRNYQHVKPYYFINKLRDIMKSNTKLPENKKMFAGWWYCCIPAATIREKGYSMPLFIRGDDMEYGIRCQPKFMTMSGICIWHVYAGKYSAPLYFYMEFRNIFIVKAATQKLEYVDVYGRWKEECMRSALTYDYEGWELLLLAIEDYMKGPKFISENHCGEILERNKKLTEKLEPLENYSDIDIYMEGLWEPDKPMTLKERALYYLTYNGQRFLPDSMMDKENVGFMKYDRDHRPGSTSFKKRIMVVNHFNSTAHVREQDKEKFKELMRRQKKDMSAFQKNNEKIVDAYRKAYPYLVSEKFWKKYLNIQEQ